MTDSQSVNLPIAIATKYLELADQVLAENLGRAPETRELADFAEVIAGNMLATMYTTMREQENPEKAEAWLRKTLSVAAATVRRLGADAIVKIDVAVKEVPNALAKRRTGQPVSPEPRPAVPAPAPACACALDSEGRCGRCCGRLAGYSEAVFPPFRQMFALSEGIKDICGVCRTGQIDYAMSTVVPSLFSLGKATDLDKLSQQVLGSLYSIAGMMGAKEMPLSEKAWRDSVQLRKDSEKVPPKL